MIALTPLNTINADTVEALLDHAFGADRHQRTAYKVRGHGAAIGALSFAACDDGVPIGTIQCWPIALAGDDARTYPLVMVGPVAVEPARQRDGVGRLLMNRALLAAGRGGLDAAMMLIGDPEYYGRFFGFTAAATAGWRLPGPVDARRLLARGDAVPAIAGLLGPRAVQPA